MPSCSRTNEIGLYYSMQFSMSAPSRVGQAPGSVDYRFVRQNTLREFRAGELHESDVCDAQPELMRVAKNYSQKSTVPCPVCGERSLRLVKYVFGFRLPAQGRVAVSRAELQALQIPRGERRCFTIEVCLECRWNHLLDIVPLANSAQRARQDKSN